MRYDVFRLTILATVFMISIGACGSPFSGPLFNDDGAGGGASIGSAGHSATASSTTGATSATGTTATGGTGGSGTGGSGGAPPCLEGCLKAPDPCHASPGACVNNACVFPPTPDGTACDDGDPCTTGDACQAGVCVGTPKTCNAPPPPTCQGSTSLVTYDDAGWCTSQGTCAYQSHVVSCLSCASGVCSQDPCAGIVCNAPPGPCYMSPGACSQGSCSYTYKTSGTACDDGNACTSNDTCNAGVCTGVPKVCTTPPPATCADPNTMETYNTQGTCSGGTCGYAPIYTSCTWGCGNGKCLPPPQCRDGIQDGSETDVDCGGGSCPRCAYYKRCSQHYDCEGDWCRYNGSPYNTCSPQCQSSPECVGGGGCCCMFPGIVQPYDYQCNTANGCAAMGGTCL